MSEPERDSDEAARQFALATIGAFAIARLAMMATLGLGRDESYTIVISRKLALSYFDHPPLHQWIAHFAALAFGETVWVRLPFVAMFALTGWLTFLATQVLFGARAGAIALFALNVTPFFFASAGGWVVPDGPLLLGLAAALLALAKLFYEAPGERQAWALWLAVGAALGFAGLSKYSAALTALGLVGFVVLSPARRRWLAHPAPYVAALLALTIVSPVFVWNAGHGWVSFRFQGGRGAPDSQGGLLQALGMILGEIAYLTPWIFAGLAAAAIAAIRKRPQDDDRSLFLLCLAAPPVLVFTLTPLWGARGIPHWTMPGWFFVYPMLGAWLGERRFDLGRWGLGSAAFLAALILLVVSQSRTGWIERMIGAPASFPDPTLESLDWGALRDAPGLSDRPDFVVVTKWWEGGKAAIALGPGVPVFVFSADPRGMAFLDNSARFVGHDAAILVARNKVASAQAQLQDYFESLDPPQFFAFGRGGRDEVEVAILRGRRLTRAFPVPYPL